jgi:syntaxin 16
MATVMEYRGVIRDRSAAFFKYKRGENFMKDRFKAKKESLFKDFHDKHSDDWENPSESLLQDDGSNTFNGLKSKKIEKKEKLLLPPKWVDQEEQVDENIVFIKNLLKDLEAEIKKVKHHLYLKIEEVPMSKIENINAQIIDLIRKSELELKDIMSFQIDNEVDNNVRKNVHYSLAIKLREFTMQTRLKEKELVKSLSENFHTQKNDLENGDDLLLDDFDADELGLQQKEQNKFQQIRSKEIEEIVAQTNDLATLFKELNILAIEQGTVLDRIDWNVETAMVHTKKGRAHLIEAKKASESTRARNVILCLVTFIVLFLVLLILKKY